MNKTERERNLGVEGEQIAAELLENLNYKIIERNYRFHRGEIDIIAMENDVLVFVEVKTRKDLEYGPPELAVTKSKQKQIKRIAEAYLYEKGISDIDCRIDVIAILLKKNLRPEINHIKNAF